ncbi:MAG: tRNA pseudouridine(55) synthase TruB [Oligoflexales bacterium]
MGRKINYIRSDLNGVLPVYKPKGMGSRDVIRHLEKKLGRVKMGHVGTLDPAADGILPVVFGQATRAQDALLALPKEYCFTIQLGQHTDTLDADGAVVEEQVFAHVVEAAVAEAVPKFVGSQQQIPPIFSAVKYKGKPLYAYAREGRAHEVPLDELSREITVHELCLESCDLSLGHISLRATCSKGTYIRVLAVQIAEALGTCGHVIELTRSQASGFELKDALSLDEIDEKIEVVASLLYPYEMKS